MHELTIASAFCFPVGQTSGPGFRILGHFLEAEVGSAMVPWALTGMLLLNYTVTLVHAAVWNPALSPAVRVENALTCFILLDLAELVAKDTSSRLKVSKTRVWLAKKTQTHLQELCGCIVIQFTTLDQPWLPWRASELVLEQYFGFVRGQFQTSQFRTRDYIHASAKKAWQCKSRLKSNPPALTPDFPPEAWKAVSDTEFALCAERALSSALRLMAVCSEHLGPIRTLLLS